MLINELSKKTKFSIHTIRYYERFGLIMGSHDLLVKSNKYSHYDEETVYKLELIRDAKMIGFTLSEIKNLLDAWYNNQLSVVQKLNVLDEKLNSIDEKIRQLEDMKLLLLDFKKDVIIDNC
jgi:MerR family transcriptional regulator, copper efflux regulator